MPNLTLVLVLAAGVAVVTPSEDPRAHGDPPASVPRPGAPAAQDTTVPPAPRVDLGAARDDEGRLAARDVLHALPRWLGLPVVYDEAEVQGRARVVAGPLDVPRADVRAVVEALLFAQGVLLLEERAGSLVLLRAVAIERRAPSSLAIHARRVTPDELPVLAARRVLVAARLPVDCGDARAWPQRLGAVPQGALSLQPTQDGRALDVVGVSSQVARIAAALAADCP